MSRTRTRYIHIPLLISILLALALAVVLLGLLILGPMETGQPRNALRLERPSLPVEPHMPDPSRLVPQVV